MIISSIFFFISAVFFCLLYWSKRSELNGGRQLIRVGNHSFDNKLTTYYEKQRNFLSSIDRQYIGDVLHRIAERGEHLVMVLGDKVINKFGRAKDMVTGKDLPKNRGAVSFFLKHIESHKKTMKKPTAHRLAAKEDAANTKDEKAVDKVALRVKMDQVEEIFENQNIEN